MIGILLVTHGRLAEELKAAALTIQPDISRMVAVALEWNQTGEDARARIAQGISQADEGDGTVILTDMFGGTPTNLTLSFLQKDRIEIVTGVDTAPASVGRTSSSETTQHAEQIYSMS